ncbi:MAG: hypothetical protein JSW39_21555 [Desulfobacterales bacterium]|nr:MAG: hypothetical protein JSW39_21555 [Desulfobacterales bacterium]
MDSGPDSKEQDCQDFLQIVKKTSGADDHQRLGHRNFLHANARDDGGRLFNLFDFIHIWFRAVVLPLTATLGMIYVQ